MKNELFDYFMDENQDTGLLVAEAPTGYGKTYQTVQAMYRYLKEGGDRKFLFVTNLLKNLPAEELRNAYAADGRASEFEREVLILASPVETIRKVIDRTEVPAAFRTPAYEALKKGFEQLESYQKYEKGIRARLEEEEDRKLREELEPAFRRELAAYLDQKISRSSAEKKEKIRCDKRYQWIRQFYPGIFWNEYKILLMSVKKLMVRNIPLIEPGFPCLSERMLNGRIVCIDEFDASKRVILDHMIEQALSMQVDYLELFLQIRSRIEEHQPSRTMLETRAKYETKCRRTWDKLIEEANEIYDSGSLVFSMKTDDSVSDYGRNFLFHDTSYHTVLHENKTHIRAVRDEERRQVRIHFEDQDTYDKHRDEPNIHLHHLLRDIHVFLRHFQSYVFGWAKVYADTENHRRKKTDNQYTSALAIESIYQDYGLTGKQVVLMTDELDQSGKWDKRDVISPDLSFYESGFRFFEFADDEHHHTKTYLQYFQMQNTPEKVLLYLCRRAKVVGLSATAELPTVTGNYDLDYLKRQLKEQYRELSPETKKKIEEELKTQWSAYEEGKVRVELTVTDAGMSGKTLRERLLDIFEQDALVRKYEFRLTGSEYFQKRYCNIFTAMKAFWAHEEIHSFLCLNKMLPEVGKEKMDLELLQQVLEDLRTQFAPESEGALCVLRSGPDFDEEKDALLEILSKGEKRFILSSYQTLGAGQNLQYAVRNRDGLICLLEGADAEDSRYFKKDIDALYLGEDTHAAVTLAGDTSLTGKELMEFCFQAECLHESGEISRRTLNQMIKEAVRNYSGDRVWAGASNAVLKRCPSIHRQVSRDFVQAVGRMNRTFLKNPTVYLFISEEALEHMDPTCLRGRTLTPEMQALAEKREEMEKEYRVPDEVRNRAERISDCGNRYIQRMLHTEWTVDSMDLWRELRTVTLTHPRPIREVWENDQILQNYYIYLEPQKKRYYFAQKGDFSDTVLCLDEDKTALSAGFRDYIVSEVSEEEARLQTILAYPGMRNYFKEHGWADSFGTGEYIMSPVLFHNIYKGALGEVAGRFILEQELSVSCRELEDPTQFEVFDYTLGHGVYVDFKHWKEGTRFDRQRMREKMLEKLDRIGGSRVLVIRLISEENSVPLCTADGRLVEIPGLLLPDGTPNLSMLQYLREMIL